MTRLSGVTFFKVNLAQIAKGASYRRWRWRRQPRQKLLLGLLSGWFFAPEVSGVVLTLTGSLVPSTTVIREKDMGTLV